MGGLAPEVEDQDLRDHFYPYGEISSIKVGIVPLPSALSLPGFTDLQSRYTWVGAGQLQKASHGWRVCELEAGFVAQILSARHCAFVTYATRPAAERAAQELQHKLIVRGQRAKLMWGKPQEKRTLEYQDGMAPPEGGPRPPPMSMLPPQVCDILTPLHSCCPDCFPRISSYLKSVKW